MSTFTPNYNIETPSPTTLFKNLGAELLAFGMSIDDLLSTFDYNGADPNLVLTRVAALEAWRTSAQAKIAALEAQSATVRRGRISRRTIAGNDVFAQNISFPVGLYSTPPVVVAAVDANARDTSVTVDLVTTTSASIRMGVNGSSARSVGATWIAYPDA